MRFCFHAMRNLIVSPKNRTEVAKRSEHVKTEWVQRRDQLLQKTIRVRKQGDSLHYEKRALNAAVYAVQQGAENAAALRKTRFRTYSNWTICSEERKRDARRLQSVWLIVWRIHTSNFFGARVMEESTTPCCICTRRSTLEQRLFSDIYAAPIPQKN